MLLESIVSVITEVSDLLDSDSDMYSLKYSFSVSLDMLSRLEAQLEEQCLTIRRSIRYDGSKHKYIIGPTKRKKVRIVDF